MKHLRLPAFVNVIEAEARIRSLARRTPLLSHPALDALAGARVLVKAECLQATGSFKIRGAANRLAQLNEAERQRGVVAFSSGNHAQGVARAAKHFGMPALIVMPSDAPQIKVSGVRADGGEVYLYDRNTESREEIAARLADERGAILVPSFDDADVIAGQGTLALELARQSGEMGARLDHLIC
jgi:threonine dehydratase